MWIIQIDKRKLIGVPLAQNRPEIESPNELHLLDRIRSHCVVVAYAPTTMAEKYI